MKKSRTKLIQIRVNAQERRRIEDFASGSRMDVSEYVRQVVLLGYTFQLQVNTPQEIQVESLTVEREAGERRQTKHASG